MLFIFPPCNSGSTNVPNPTWDIVPGLFAAISLNIWAITPCGKLYPVSSFALAKFPNSGANPQCPPITLLIIPLWANLFNPVPALAFPKPAANIILKSLGLPVSKKDFSIS